MSRLISLLLGLTISCFSSGFGQHSLKFEEKINKNCGIIVKSPSGIAFKDEEIKRVGHIQIISNSHNAKEVQVSIKKLRKSTNLQQLHNRQIKVIIDRNKEFFLDELIKKEISLSKGHHTLYLEIDTPRTHVLSGTASLQFDFKINCNQNN